MPSAAVNGVRLYYERHGDSGEPLVFVHGYTGDISDWRLQMAEFAGDYRALAMDLRGHGKSEAPVDRQLYTVELMTRDVEELVDIARFERFHLVGHSMGGAIAQEMALSWPERLLSLTLVDTALKFSVPADDPSFQVRAQRLQAALNDGMAAAAALTSADAPPHMPPERIEETNQRLARMSLDAFVGAVQGLFGWEGSENRLPQIRTPTLIIYGELDGPSLVKSSLKMAKLIPNAKLEPIPEASHSPQWERPELFNAALRRHLEANRG
ncbi:MAG: alpha/beta hydrolase [Dehalococcoidia bacterium]|jgi:3-oxoadipate enol-lactonase